MYIHRIKLKDFKGFSEVDFDLRIDHNKTAQWNVFTGDNASGKTALLKAIAIALVGPETSRILMSSLKGFVKEGCSSAHISLEIFPGDEDRFAGGGAPYKGAFWSEVKFSRLENDALQIEADKLFRGNKKGPSRGLWSDSTSGWFCAGYGPFRRLYGHSPEAQRIMSTSGKVTRFATLFREDATLAESDLWLKDLNHRALSGDGAANETQRTVVSVLNDNFFPNGIKVERVDPDGLWLKQSDGTILDLRDMSDGFRSAAALVMDILRNIVDVFGARNLVDEAGHVQHAGVVLIDEIDAHLHPKWQREIGSWFKRIFPRIQFLVTTHSPLICQEADHGSIFHLPIPSGEEKPFRVSNSDYQKIITGKPDTILLTSAFGLKHTRSVTAVKARNEYSLLQTKKRQASLTKEEEKRQMELSCFVDEEEPCEE